MTSRNETPDQAARRAIRRVKLEGLDAAVRLQPVGPDVRGVHQRLGRAEAP